MTDEYTGKQILDLPIYTEYVDVDTVREYLVAVLCELYSEEEGFSGECVFDNFNWVKDLHIPLIASGIVEATVDKGIITRYDSEKAHEYIFKAINALGMKDE